MGMQSWGYKGTIDESQWAQMAAFFGTRYAVRALADWNITAILNERQVSISPGLGFGNGVADSSDEAVVLALPAPPTTIGQWYLLCARRDWADSSTEFVLLAGDGTDGTTPTVWPLSYPAERQSAPGVVDDQPLFWTWVKTSSTDVVLFDLRTYAIGDTFEAIPSWIASAVADEDIHGQVVTEVAGYPAVVGAAADAADAAVAVSLAGTGVVVGGGPITPVAQLAFSVVDADGRRSWLEVGQDGRPSGHALDILTTDLFAPIGSSTKAETAYSITDSDGHRSWIEISVGGRPTQHSIDLIKAGLALDPIPVPSGPGIALVGHSMLAQATGIITAALSSAVVTGMAVGGEPSVGIAARQGGNPYLFLPVGGVIPASGGVDVTLSNASGGSSWPMLQGPSTYLGNLQVGAVKTPGVFSVIRDPAATQYYHHAGDRYVFTRSLAGSSIPLVRPAPFYLDTAEAIRDDVVIYWAGRNNLWAPDQIMTDLQAMILHQTPIDKRFLIIGELNSTTETETPLTNGATEVLEINDRYRALWGRRYIDLRGYLLAYGLSDAGLTPTAQDLDELAAGTVPTSLRNPGDTLHLNPAGSTVLASLITLRLQEMGWY